MNDSRYSVGISHEAALVGVNLTLSGIISDTVKDIIIAVNAAILCAILVIFGTVTNVINIIVFFKTGFKEPVNITLFALAISDLGCCLSLVMIALCLNPYFRQLDLPFEPDGMSFLTSSWPHATFSRMTSVITAFTTFERCLCVAFPLQVKEIITPKRVTVLLVCATIVVLGLISPIFFSAVYVWKFNEERNRSVLTLTFLEEYTELVDITKSIHSVFIPLAAFFVVLVSTIVLVRTLRRKTKWRESTNVAKSSNALSTRDTKISQMMVMIATLFIVCYIPVIFPYALIIAEPEFHFSGRYRNANIVAFSFHFVLEALNSSLNIFIYYRMSSGYRAIFLQLFGIKSKERQQ